MASMESDFERITIDPNQMCGVSCIRGLRTPVAYVARMVATPEAFPPRQEPASIGIAKMMEN